MGEHKHAEQPLNKTFSRRSWQQPPQMIKKHTGIPLQSNLNALERVQNSGGAHTTIELQNEEFRGAHHERARKDLENKVRERTAEIQRVNLELVKEVEARKIMEDALREKSRELEIRTERLEEANTTLKVLLRERDSERRELEERVASNINELIRPHLSKLCAANLGERRQALANAIGRGLEDITSPLSRRFIMECSHLTPMETQVAGLIRQGRTTKEISDLMGVASSTVDYHRFNIRRKLDLTNKRINLQSYLKSLS
jgi:DNA-binding CsgD family transcriptional regulator